MNKLLIAVLGAALLAGGCSSQFSPAVNSVDLTKVDFSDAKSFKVGEACGIYILGFIGPFFGDARIIDAVKSANIKKVSAVDYKGYYYLFFSKNCVVVYGV